MRDSIAVDPLTSQSLRCCAAVSKIFVTVAMVAAASLHPVFGQSSSATAAPETPRLLLMTPDVKYYILTAGGVSELQAEWTDASRNNISNAIRGYNKRALEVVMTRSVTDPDDVEISYEKLHFAVGRSILTHHFGQFKLPSKANKLDWTLGPGVSAIGDRYGADYALFTYYRDYTSSGGRVALAIFAALAGVGVPGGGGGGFASLVDLRSGDVVSFQRLPETDFRVPEGAGNAVNKLLTKMLPK